MEGEHGVAVSQSWVRRAVDGSVKDLPTANRDRGSGR